jgi:pimeloyl-ACP methyl ester carboxylesterase
MAGHSGSCAGLYYETLFWDGEPRPPLVVLPGLMSDGRQVRRLLRELHRKTVVLDPLGSGKSEAPDSPAEYALPAAVPRLRAVLHELRIERAELLGLSMGGMWAQEALLADDAGLFERAVLVGTCARVTPRMRSLLLGLRSVWQHGVPQLDAWRILQGFLFAPDFLERPSTIPLLELLASDAGRSAHTVLCQIDALLAHDAQDRLPALGERRVVRGLCAGELDILMPPSAQHELSEALAGAPVKLLPGAGHAAWIEQPTSLAEAVARALCD